MPRPARPCAGTRPRSAPRRISEIATSRGRAAAGIALAALAVAAGSWFVRPLDGALIGPDAAAPVIDWQRLLAGQRLEGYLSQTSKPLLTLVYGVLYDLSHDWRSVALAAIAAYAALVALGTLLATRVAGRAAGAFVAVGLLLSPAIMADVVLAYGLPWEVLAWVLAGLALTGSRRRPGLAGAALAAGALARPETLAVTGTGLGLLALATAWALATHRAPPARSLWLVAIGLLAIPILAVHDWALTGDALFWLNSAQANSATATTHFGLLRSVRFVGGYVVSLRLLVPLAAVGGAVLLSRRRWVELAGCVAVTIGVAAFWILVGSRGTTLTIRYLEPIGVGMLLTAAPSLGLLEDRRVVGWVRERRDRFGWLDGPAARPLAISLALVAVGATLALVSAHTWLRSSSVAGDASHERTLQANARRAFAVMRKAIPDPPAWRGHAAPANAAAVAWIPPRLRAQAVVDLDLPLWAVQKSFASDLDLAMGEPPAGTLLYHDANDDGSGSRWAAIEVDRPTTVGAVRVVPLLVDPSARIWVVRIESASP